MPAWIPAAIAATTSLITSMMAKRAAKRQDRRAMAMARETGRTNVAQAKELTEFNRGMGMRTWEETSAPEQRKQIEKAGLNVGLMYGGAPGGGSTTVTPGQGQQSTPQAAEEKWGMGMQLGAQAAQMAANIELTKAQTENVKADTVKKTGVDTQQVIAAIDQLKQTTQNAKVQEGILNYEKSLKEIEADVSKTTYEEQLQRIRFANDKLYGEAQSAMTKGEIDKATQEQVTKQINTASIEQALRIGLQRKGLIQADANITHTNAQIKQIAENIQNANEQMQINWDKQNQNEKEVIIKQILAEFATSDAAKAKQWSDLIGSIMSSALGAAR